MFDDAAERRKKKKFVHCTYVESLIVIDIYSFVKSMIVLVLQT